MGGSHAKHAARESRELRRLALVIIVPLALLTLGLMIWLWPTEDIEPTEQSAAPETNAVVLGIESEPCPDDFEEEVNGCGTADVELTDAEDDYRTLQVPLPNGPGAPEIDVGDDIVLIETEGPEGDITYSIVDHQRSAQLWILALAFVLALIAFGRWRGVTALAGLAVTFGVLMLFVVPAILTGEPPLLVAIVGSAAIVLTVLYLTHGFSMSTSVAVLGTLASLAIAGVLSAVSVSAMELTGITDDITTTIGVTYQVNMSGLLLAGIVIGTIGVLDDVTITQSATVSEVARANPAYRFVDLYRAGVRVGRSHIASVVNTIILAYAGSSLPLLILIIGAGNSFDVVTNQVIAQEIARSAIGTLGLISAVPITTALAALVAHRRHEPVEAP